MANTSAGHVVAAAFPYGSHSAPLLAAVRGMAAASPGTVFSFFGTRQSNKSVFRGDHEAMVRAYEVWDGVPEGRAVAPTSFQERIELFMVAAPAQLKAGFEAAERDTGRKVTCLVTDAFLWFGAEMAQKMGVPWVPFWTSGAASLSAHIYTDAIRANSNHVDGLSFVPGLSKVMLKDLPPEVVFTHINPFFSEMMHKMGLELPRAAAVSVNSFEELDEEVMARNLGSRLNAYLNVAPLSLVAAPDDQDRDCLSWLDERGTASVAYISFGSVTVPPEGELVAVAQALEESGVPFLWSLRDNGKAMLPKGFLEATKGRGTVVGWAPQAEVLRHEAVGVFVTHCGWNSVVESIVGGVPMIGRPFFGDHMLNGRMVQSVWEVGVCVDTEGLSKQALEHWLAMFLRPDEEGKRIRDNVKKLSKLAALAVGPTGSSTKNFQKLVDIITKP